MNPSPHGAPLVFSRRGSCFAENGKWGCFLHLPEHEEPIFLGKEFKTEERAENWLNTSEAVTAVDMMPRKYKKVRRIPGTYRDCETLGGRGP